MAENQDHHTPEYCSAHGNMNALLEKLDNVVASLVKVSNDMKWVKIIGYFLIGLSISVGIPGVWSINSRVTLLEKQWSLYEVSGQLTGNNIELRIARLEEEVNILKQVTNQHLIHDDLRYRELKMKVDENSNNGKDKMPLDVYPDAKPDMMLPPQREKNSKK